jgi:transcriptional regulator with XRE-family HTH domain
MVNIEDFIKRLEIILDYYSLNASSFADKIGVQRSSLSHLLSGRNKPSLDFILKILDVYPDIDLYWILNGTGSFPKNMHAENLDKPLETIPKQISPTPINSEINSEDLFAEAKNANLTNVFEVKQTKKETTIEESISGEIEKIVFFYKNGTFKVFNPDSF